jgi:hypothetical protein
MKARNPEREILTSGEWRSGLKKKYFSDAEIT